MLPPHIEFDQRLTRAGGVEAVHIGGRHAEESTVVRVPDSGVLLHGDCFYPPPYHLREPDDGYDEIVIRRVLDRRLFGEVDWYVSSHDDPGPRAALQSLLGAEAHQ
jgi:glyoxylase-like metal-dependent hydrolase (beta-lactamase superfamily II)